MAKTLTDEEIAAKGSQIAEVYIDHLVQEILADPDFKDLVEDPGFPAYIEALRRQSQPKK